MGAGYWVASRETTSRAIPCTGTGTGTHANGWTLVGLISLVGLEVQGDYRFIPGVPLEVRGGLSIHPGGTSGGTRGIIGSSGGYLPRYGRDYRSILPVPPEGVGEGRAILPVPPEVPRDGRTGSVLL